MFRAFSIFSLSLGSGVSSGYKIGQWVNMHAQWHLPTMFLPKMRAEGCRGSIFVVVGLGGGR